MMKGLYAPVSVDFNLFIIIPINLLTLTLPHKVWDKSREEGHA